MRINDLVELIDDEYLAKGYRRYLGIPLTITKIGPMASQYLLENDSGDICFWAYWYNVTPVQLSSQENNND